MAKSKGSPPRASPSRKPGQGGGGGLARRWSGGRIAAFGGGAVALVLAGAMAAGIAGEDRNPPEGVVDVPIGAPAHVEGDIDYDGHPAGGEHSAAWLNCGVYDAPVPEEVAVHSLEHGAIWLTHRSDADPSLIEDLWGYAGRGKVIVSPVEGQVAAIVATAWGRQMEADDPADPNIGRFITEFQSSGSAPEPGGPCDGGVGVPL